MGEIRQCQKRPSLLVWSSTTRETALVGLLRSQLRQRNLQTYLQKIMSHGKGAKKEKSAGEVECDKRQGRSGLRAPCLGGSWVYKQRGGGRDVLQDKRKTAKEDLG